MKNCTKCGNTLEDEAVFCNACGEAQKENTQTENTYTESEELTNSFLEEQDQPVYIGNPDMPVKKSKKPLIIGISIAAVLVIAAIVVGLVLFLGGGKSNSPEEIVKEFLVAYKNLDGDAVADCIAYTSKYKDEMEEMREEINAAFEMLKAFDDSIKITYSMGSVKKVTGDALEEFWEEAEDSDVLVEEKDVKDIRVCEATIKMEAFGEEDEEEMTVYVAKYKGDWKVIYTE